VSTVITDYEAYSTYHFRIVASNPVGETVSEDKTFETLPAPLPVVSGTTFSGVSPSGATLEAKVNPMRWATVYLFEYGTTPNYEEWTDISSSIGSDEFDHEVSAAISGLSAGTTYHFRAVAINFTGTKYGSDVAFTTPDRPRIDSSSSSSVGQTSAHLEAAVSPSSSATTVHFEYGTSTKYGSSTAEASIGSGTADQQVAADLSGLSPGTTYHFRAVATNSIGTTFGPDQTFATQQAPAPNPEPAPKKKKVKCKRGFVKRHGKCVRKHRKHRKKHRRHSNGRHG
jgi:hypothetical protein